MGYIVCFILGIGFGIILLTLYCAIVVGKEADERIFNKEDK